MIYMLCGPLLSTFCKCLLIFYDEYNCLFEKNNSKRSHRSVGQQPAAKKKLQVDNGKEPQDTVKGLAKEFGIRPLDIRDNNG